MELCLFCNSSVAYESKYDVSVFLHDPLLQTVQYPALLRRDKPRRVDTYFSSWVIKPGNHYPSVTYSNSAEESKSDSEYERLC